MSYITWKCPGCGTLITEDHDIPEEAQEWCSVRCMNDHGQKYRMRPDGDYARGFQAGAEAIREAAAKVCMAKAETAEYAMTQMSFPASAAIMRELTLTLRLVARNIRALPLPAMNREGEDT